MTVLDRFTPPPAEPTPPADGEIAVWAVALDPAAEWVARMARLLSADETARARRFRFERHRRRFTVGRGVLRTLLGRYLDIAPEAVVFDYGVKGKPFLAPGAGGTRPLLHFNLANSDELALVAFSAGQDLGIDLERLRPMPDGLAIAERFFSAAERQVLAAQPEGDRDRAFFRCWTRKEAYLKAVGDGITVRLDGFDVTLGEDEPPRLLSIDGDADRATAWTVVHLEPQPGYLGALVLPSRSDGRPSVRGWRWSG